MKKRRLEPTPMLFPMPAVLVSTYGENDIPDAMTAAWAAVCCHKPVSMGVAVRENRLTYENLERRNAFCINIPTTSQAGPTDYLGIVSGKQNPEKLNVAGLEVARGTEIDAPLVVGCPINIECRLSGRLPIGTHTWFVGEVMAVHVNENLLRENGTVDVKKLDPLVYCTSVGEYWSLGEPVGKAYSIGKDLKKD